MHLGICDRILGCDALLGTCILNMNWSGYHKVNNEMDTFRQACS